MPLTEKELETYLWEQPAACQARGLTIGQHFLAEGRRYQRLALGPYGPAQQVSVRFWPAQQCYYVQVVAFTTGAITPAMYLKTKRQLSGLRDLLLRSLKAADVQASVAPSCVLIGKQVQLAGDLVFTLNLDATCQAFTYCYDATGIHFEHAGRQWGYKGSEQAPDLAALAKDLLQERVDALSISQAERADWLTSATAEPGEYSSLVVTAGGIVEQEDMAGEGLADE